MPVIKIFYDETLDAVMRAGVDAITAELNTVSRTVMAADPANCQVILSAAMQVRPQPVYVDLQFRANDYRTRTVVADAMARIASALTAVTGTGVRVRAFDIDQSTLHALDTAPAAPALAEKAQ